MNILFYLYLITIKNYIVIIIIRRDTTNKYPYTTQIKLLFNIFSDSLLFLSSLFYEAKVGNTALEEDGNTDPVTSQSVMADGSDSMDSSVKRMRLQYSCNSAPNHQKDDFQCFVGSSDMLRSKKL